MQFGDLVLAVNNVLSLEDQAAAKNLVINLYDVTGKNVYQINTDDLKFVTDLENVILTNASVDYAHIASVALTDLEHKEYVTQEAVEDYLVEKQVPTRIIGEVIKNNNQNSEIFDLDRYEEKLSSQM